MHANGNLTVHSGVDGRLLGHTRISLSIDASVAPRCAVRHHHSSQPAAMSAEEHTCLLCAGANDRKARLAPTAL